LKTERIQKPELTQTIHENRDLRTAEAPVFCEGKLYGIPQSGNVRPECFALCGIRTMTAENPHEVSEKIEKFTNLLYAISNKMLICGENSQKVT